MLATNKGHTEIVKCLVDSEAALDLQSQVTIYQILNLILLELEIRDKVTL